MQRLTYVRVYLSGESGNHFQLDSSVTTILKGYVDQRDSYFGHPIVPKAESNTLFSGNSSCLANIPFVGELYG